jgi:ectoine hydroxylase-related dioxygenase (phytanoyl-CoA dioxygenase family)
MSANQATQSAVRDVELARRYRADGYVKLPALFDPARIGEIARHIGIASARAAENMRPGDYVLEPDGAVRNLWRLEAYDEFFAAVGNDSRVVGIVERLLGAAATLMAVETFNKPARQGTAVPPHQDNAYFCQAPPDVLTVWVAIDATTEHNGPVHYVRESRETLLPHKGSGIPGNSMLLIDPPRYDDKRVQVGLLEPGDAMVHHCQTIHWSEPNRTESPRCGMLLVYRARHTATAPELRAAYERAAAEYAGS